MRDHEYEPGHGADRGGDRTGDAHAADGHASVHPARATLTRRRALAGAGALLALAASGASAAAASAPEGAASTAGVDADPRLVFVVLRGAMDGLAVVPPVGDPAFAAARTALLPVGGAVAPLPLDGFFALHPLLPELHAAYARRELAIAHAVCTPYRARSHFDGQNVLETGVDAPFAAQDGWLNRALDVPRQDGRPRAVGLAPALPLLLRGAAPATSWAPSYLPDPNDDLLARVGALYANDPALARALREARAVHGGAGTRDGRAEFVRLAEAAAGLLLRPGGPRVAVLELAGWDTHAAQAQPAGGLARNLRQLDAGIAALRTGLGDAWRHTVVLAASEFGRTVRGNGTAGTDHGTGGVAFVVGGAVHGGRVLADWPGLAPAQLLDGRDLRPTRDVRALFAAVLHAHLRVPQAQLTRTVFPALDPVAWGPFAGLAG